MNHIKHWRDDPVYEPRPHDTRLRRVYVFKYIASDNPSGKRHWHVAMQSRNSATTEWRIREVYIFNKYQQAIALARLSVSTG